jgi:hypothetical protein
MKRLRIIGVGLAALFAMSAVLVSSALAASTNNPQWKLCEEVAAGTGKFTNSACTTAGVGSWEFNTLKAGQEHPLEGRQNGTQTLVVKSGSNTSTIKCNKMTLNSGKVLGSNAPEPGTAEATLAYRECEEEGNKTCEINKEAGGSAKITTHALKAKLVYSSLIGAEKENEAETDTLFEPKEGTTFVALELGAACKVKGINSFEGKVLAENIHAAEHLAEHELNFKAGKYWTNEAGKSVEHSVGALKSSGGAELTISGKISIWIEIGPVKIYIDFSF